MPNYLDIITGEDILEYHRLAIQLHGGDDTQRPFDPDCVNSIIRNSINGANYMKIGDNVDPIHLAACLLIYAVKAHCFVDGNKRIAWILSCDALLRHGYDVSCTDEEAEQLIGLIVEGKATKEVVVDWLAKPGRIVEYVSL